MKSNRYSFLLAFAGLSVTFMFCLVAAILIYFSANLIQHGGFFPSVFGVAILLPMVWAMFLAIGVAARTIVHQP